MSLIQCNSDCIYERDGYCKLEKAAEVTSSTGKNGCLHYRERSAAPKIDSPAADETPRN